ncbi:hypothetical protein M3P05_08315 [Sansalvadorimonas sp. 2012CJ34-2]|uniref:Uncharacterized protein n=1 Tax=Parendozoicomonas callyspongiae TaxID=2942213 RepID=A0ABT0PEZ4_9GAMM|nr:hypothetical protein [Sansalvadorimonas sp. 2012CJ34-2]MCL6269940.1 hypothetical protein [Sansalvadorimonas sp. 2012CJ34-2]
MWVKSPKVAFALFSVLLFNMLLCPSALAVKINIVGSGICYEYSGDDLKAKAFSGLLANSGSGSVPANRVDVVDVGMPGYQKRYIQLVSDRTEASGTGSLNVIVLVPADKAAVGTQHSLRYLDTDYLVKSGANPPSLEDIDTLFENLSISEAQDGKLGMHSNSLEAEIGEAPFSHGDFTLTAPNYAVALGFSVENIAHESILFSKPQIFTEGRSAIFNSQNDEPGDVPNDFLLIMHYVDSAGHSKLALHTMQGKKQQGKVSGDDYNLGVTEKLALSLTVNISTIKQVALLAGVNDYEIDALIGKADSLPSNTVYGMLQRIDDTVENGSSALYLSELLKRAGDVKNAQRILERNLGLSEKDRELKQQMLQLGIQLNGVAEKMASMVLEADDVAEVKRETTSTKGYKLLALALQRNRLNKVYRQLRERQYHAILGDLQSPQMKILKELMLISEDDSGEDEQGFAASTVAIPEDLNMQVRLYKKYSNGDFSEDFSLIETERLEDFLKLLFGVHRAKYFTRDRIDEQGFLLESVENYFWELKKKTKDESTAYLNASDVNYGMLVHWLNHRTLPMELRSVAWNILNRLAERKLHPSRELAESYKACHEGINPEKGEKVSTLILKASNDFRRRNNTVTTDEYQGVKALNTGPLPHLLPLKPVWK